MFETSKDILYLVIAFCVLWLTVFMCWLLFYFISIISNARKVAKSIHEKLEKVDEIINLVKGKVENSATHLAILVEGVGKLVDYFKNKKSVNKPTPPRRAKKKNKVEEL